MPLDSQVLSAQPDQIGRIKHLFSPPEASFAGQPYAPSIYFEARVDFADVRSGCHVTCDKNCVLDIVQLDDELVWTTDMVRTIDPARLVTAKPEAVTLRKLPDFVNESFLFRAEALYLSFLIRHTTVRLFRNFALSIYSHFGETREEFESRCMEEFNDSFRADLDVLREVVNRRLERIATKYVGGRAGEYESDRRVTQARSKMHAMSERFAELFIQTELTSDSGPLTPRRPNPSHPDLEQNLDTLETEVRMEIRRLRTFYWEKVQNIDEYIIRPNFKDLHLVRTCILWMPEGAAGP